MTFWTTCMKTSLERRALLGALLCGAAAPALAFGTDAASGLLRAGDVVFRLGTQNSITELIVRYSPLPAARRRWSHAGVVVAPTRGGGALVAHALEAGVVLETFEVFRSESRAVGVLRGPAEAAQTVALTASSMLGRPFDDRLSLTDDGERIYCTEMLKRALAAAGVRVGWTLNDVPFFSEDVLHPDSAWLDMLRGGFKEVQV